MIRSACCHMTHLNLEHKTQHRATPEPSGTCRWCILHSNCSIAHSSWTHPQPLHCLICSRTLRPTFIQIIHCMSPGMISTLQKHAFLHTITSTHTPIPLPGPGIAIVQQAITNRRRFMVSNSIRLFFMDIQTVVSIAVLSNLEKEEHEENCHMHDFIERIA